VPADAQATAASNAPANAEDPLASRRSVGRRARAVP